MEAVAPAAKRTVRWIGRLGRVLLIVWAAFWLWFNVASLVSEWADHGVGALFNHGPIALVVLVVGVVAWLWPLRGGVLLLGLAGFGQWFFQPTIQSAMLLTIPPALTGWLLIADRIARRRPASG